MQAVAESLRIDKDTLGVLLYHKGNNLTCLLFMLSSIFFENVVERVCGKMGVGCEDWRRCRCEDCVQLRRMIVKVMVKCGFSRRQIVAVSGWSRTSIAEYVAVRSEGLAAERVMSEIIRELFAERA